MISRSQKLLATILLLALCLAAVLVSWFLIREPQAEGKRLSYWIRQVKILVKVVHDPSAGGVTGKPEYIVMLPNLTVQELASLIPSTNVQTIGYDSAMIQMFQSWPDRIEFASADESNEDQAARAIRGMGAAALPALRAGLYRRASSSPNFFVRWVWPRLPMHLKELFGTPIHPVHRRANCAYALGLLGTAAIPAVADLQLLVSHDENALVRSVALEALHRIQPGAAGRFYPELFRQTQPEPHILPSGNTNSSDIFSPTLSL